MSEQAELHLLKARIADLEATVEIIDRGRERKDMALRDTFAAAALTGLCAGFSADGTWPNNHRPEGYKAASEYAYALADAMLAERVKK